MNTDNKETAMYFYKIGSADAEGEMTYQFTHKKRYTKKQLEKILAEVLIELIGEEAHIATMMGEHFYRKDMITKMKERGFTPVNYTAVSYVEGFLSVFNKEERDKWPILTKMLKGKIWEMEIELEEWTDTYYTIAETEDQAREKFQTVIPPNYKTYRIKKQKKSASTKEDKAGSYPTATNHHLNRSSWS
jgi:hypothetical protein